MLNPTHSTLITTPHLNPSHHRNPPQQPKVSQHTRSSSSENRHSAVVPATDERARNSELMTILLNRQDSDKFSPVCRRVRQPLDLLTRKRILANMGK